MDHPFPSHIIALTSFLHMISMAFSIFCWKVTILSVMRFSPQSSCSNTPPPISRTIMRAASWQPKLQRADVCLGMRHTLHWESLLWITVVTGAVARSPRRTHSIMPHPEGQGFHRASRGAPKGPVAPDLCQPKNSCQCSHGCQTMTSIVWRLRVL